MVAPSDIMANPGDPAANPLDRLRQALGRLNSQQKLLLMVALAALIALVVGAVLWAKQPDYKVLFSNLNEKDGGDIIAQLEQQNVPHQFSGTGAILVPAARVHEVRLKLAQQGLPRGGSIGFEIMDNPPLGQSQFAEQVKYQRALEGELGKTIRTVAAVREARVHLAIPKPSVFVSNDQKPTASVLVGLYPGRTLDPAQVAGITHLVASSVPQMPVTGVTVVDQNGALLSSLKSQAGLDPEQARYVRNQEDAIIRRIDDIIKPVLGADNYKVQVAADVDFSQTEETAETYSPNTTPGSSSVRSEQVNETANVNSTTGGVPGALSNQPPVPATAPLTAPAAGAAGASRGSGEPGKVDAAGVTGNVTALTPPVSTTKNKTTNYELPKSIRHTKQAVGTLKRVSAAVVVNYRKETGKDGKPTTKPMADEDVKKINSLVREAMGFNEKRGDTLSIVSAPFTAVEKVEISTPVWKDPDIVARALDIAKYLLLAAIAAYLWFKVIQPLVKTMFPPPPPLEDQLAAAAGRAEIIEEESEDQVELTNYTAKIQRAREVAQNDPKAVANIIKDWMTANAG